MSIDRRIVSILYHNGIKDVNSVEEFIGEKNNYYEIKINGEIKKLKIPGYSYFEVAGNNIEEIYEDIKSNFNDMFQITIEEKTEIIKNVEEPVVEEPVVEEPVVEEIKVPIVKKNVKSKKEIKKIDTDIDDFINLA